MITWRRSPSATGSRCCARAKLVQVGTREDLWHRPADIFVARAFGQPQINVIPGEIASAHGRLYLPQPGRRGYSAASGAASGGWDASRSRAPAS